MAQTGWGSWRAIRNCFLISLLFFAVSFASCWLGPLAEHGHLTPEERAAAEDIGMPAFGRVAAQFMLLIPAACSALLGLIQLMWKASKYS